MFIIKTNLSNTILAENAEFPNHNPVPKALSTKAIGQNNRGN